jgi:tRNA nucleotidyltransferase (CCA-adding enzyme)
MHDFDEVMRSVLGKISPTLAERVKIEGVAADLEHKVRLAAEEFGVKAKVRLEGSVAKDTWISNEPDVDVFMCLPSSIPRKSLGEVSLKIARKATEGAVQVERFAEHPYLEAFLEGIRVNVVPCYDVEQGDWLSATDRTPFHTDYVNVNLEKKLRNEVRLLKRFMKGIDVYGAEIRVGGFSGYLCELLVLNYGSFRGILEAFGAHVTRRVIDIEKYFESRERELEHLFPEALVVIDPVDKARNVASPVQPVKLQLFAAASRAFLKSPSEEFFFSKKTRPLSAEKFRGRLGSSGSAFLFIVFDRVNAVSDVLWGQLYRTCRSLRKVLENSDFRVLRDTVYSEDTEEFSAFVFELEQQILPLAKKHLGPPLERRLECENFLSKYLDNKDVLSGPYLENDRWVVHIKRKHCDAVDLLRSKLKEGGKDAGVAELVTNAFRKDFEVLVGIGVSEYYLRSKSFSAFLSEFLVGKPFWLRTTS